MTLKAEAARLEAREPRWRILFFGINYAPEQTACGPFNAGLCQALAASGHEVTVVTAYPYYPQWRVHAGYRRHLVSTEMIADVRVVRVWHFIPNRPRNLLQRLLHDVTYSLTALVASVLVAKNIDLVICSTPPPFLPLVGSFLAWLHRAPLLVKVTDVASSAASELGILPSGVFTRLAQVIEGSGLKRADRVIVLTESFVPPLISMGVRRDRIRAIPDWADSAELAPIEGNSNVRADVLRLNEKQLVLHTGNIGLKQHLVTMVDAAALSDDSARWVLVGDGEERAALVQHARSRGVSQLSFLPLQERERFRELLAAADVLLLVQSKSIKNQVIPSKLLAYLAAGRPIVASVDPDSEAARIVRTSGAGVIVQAEDPKALADAVRDLRDRPEDMARMATNARHFAEEHFASRVILQAYSDEIDVLASAARRR